MTIVLSFFLTDLICDVWWFCNVSNILLLAKYQMCIKFCVNLMMKARDTGNDCTRVRGSKNEPYIDVRIEHSVQDQSAIRWWQWTHREPSPPAHLSVAKIQQLLCVDPNKTIHHLVTDVGIGYATCQNGFWLLNWACIMLLPNLCWRSDNWSEAAVYWLLTYLQGTSTCHLWKSPTSPRP